MSSFDVKSKFAIVTGAGSGINHAFAEQLLNGGCLVIFADVALRPEAEEMLAKFPYPAKDGAPSAVFHQMDQSDWSQISETWDVALKTFDRVDLFCPEAGIWEPPTTTFWNPPGVSLECKDDLKAPPGNKVAGNLVFVASLNAYLSSIGTPLYNSSKAGLCAFAMSLAQMRSRLEIRVAVICPATIFIPAVVKEYYVGKVREEDMNMTSVECAEVMLSIMTDAQYGNSQVVEAMRFGTEEKPDIKVRIVSCGTLLPPIDPSGDFSGKNILVKEEKGLEETEDEGHEILIYGRMAQWSNAPGCVLVCAVGDENKWVRILPWPPSDPACAS